MPNELVKWAQAVGQSVVVRGKDADWSGELLNVKVVYGRRICLEIATPNGAKRWIDARNYQTDNSPRVELMP